MKKTVQILLFAIALLTSAASQAQTNFLKEDFTYPTGVPLVQNPVVSTENIDLTTGWRTMNNTNSATNSFNIIAGLTYAGHPGSGVGGAMKILDNAGQDVFKSFSPVVSIAGPKTMYFSFLINVPPGDKTGTDFIYAFKYANSALDANYFGRLFITVAGDSVSFGISKSTSPAGASTSMIYKTNTTYFVVMKYIMGGLNGATTTDETGNYDDRVVLFVNPTLTGVEPPTPTLSYANAADRDAYRYSATNTIIGGFATVYFRTPTVGAIPEATFDAIRVNDAWSIRTNVKDLAENKAYSIYTDATAKTLNVKLEDNSYNQYEIYNITGQLVRQNKVNQTDFSVNLSAYPAGVYILKMQGEAKSSASKFIIH